MNMIQEIERQFEELAATDKAAKDAGTLIGRHIRESIADGHAYYRIVATSGGMATVKHLHICDGYRIPLIESMGGKIPLKYARENIKFRDRMDELFANK